MVNFLLLPGPPSFLQVEYEVQPVSASDSSGVAQSRDSQFQVSMVVCSSSFPVAVRKLSNLKQLYFQVTVHH